MTAPSPLRLIFAGTPEFAATHLAALLDTPHQICAVYTQPDRPAGRGRKLKASPVKQLALEHGLEVRQPKTLNTVEEAAHLTDLQADLMVVVAYGVILNQAALNAPKLGCINVHASLLPLWRGAAPIQRAIEAGDAETGITLMRMVRALDAGAILSQTHCPIHNDDTAASLHDRLAILGAETLRARLQDFPSHPAGRAQNDDEATYAHKLNKPNAVLNWQDTAHTLDRKIRAFHPWPIAFTHFQTHTLRILAAEPLAAESHAASGTVVNASKHGIDVATGEHGVLRLTRMQMAGKKPMSAANLLNGLTLNTGDIFH